MFDLGYPQRHRRQHRGLIVYGLKRAWVASATWLLYGAISPWEMAGAKGSLDREAQAVGADSALARYSPNSIKWLGHEPKVLAPVAVGSENVATGTYIGEGRSNILSAPDRALTRSSYLFSGPTKGGRERGNAPRLGSSIRTWSRG